MNEEKFNYLNNNEFELLDNQCQSCTLFNNEINECLFYKKKIPTDVVNNFKKCEYLKQESVLDDIDSDYKYYSKLYFDKFGKKAFITMPGGTKEKTIEAIKKSLEENKDLLGEIFNPNEDNILY